MKQMFGRLAAPVLFIAPRGLGARLPLSIGSTLRCREPEAEEQKPGKSIPDEAAASESKTKTRILVAESDWHVQLVSACLNRRPGGAAASGDALAPVYSVGSRLKQDVFKSNNCRGSEVDAMLNTTDPQGSSPSVYELGLESRTVLMAVQLTQRLRAPPPPRPWETPERPLNRPHIHH
ncbi:hypothetical protein EYF80_035131 [Liparis tanakae]|uniref:Uncharacterized protein n=1 Tax=Liparis tanakae TaxID=230148 RepID=A0A4Z2GN44_9TELE|nr:hypothetical protein EYF80_035131 [Liparis tanakae]